MGHETSIGAPIFHFIPLIAEEIQFLRRKLPELPWQVDTEEASVSIFRIAETYGMMPWDMANGLIDNIRFK